MRLRKVLTATLMLAIIAYLGVNTSRLSGSPDPPYRKCGDGSLTGENGKCRLCKNVEVNGLFIWSIKNNPVGTYKMCTGTYQFNSCFDSYTFTCQGTFYSQRDCQGEVIDGETSWTENTCTPPAK